MKQSRHHRKPQSRGGKGNARNISIVPEYHHKAWHTLFVNYDAYEIAEIINKVWLDPDVYFVVKRRRE